MNIKYLACHKSRIVKEDGFFDFWPLYRPGTYWPEWLLRGIADKLRDLNKEWNRQIDVSIR